MRIIKKLKSYSIRISQLEIREKILAKNNLEIGFASISTVKHTVHNDMMQYYRTEIVQDFISKNYSHMR